MDAPHPLPTAKSVQIVKSASGEEYVFLSKAEFDTLIEALNDALEDLEDIAAFDAARAEIDDEKLPPFPPQVNAALFRGDRRLAAIRKWRGLTVGELAAKSAIAETDVAAFESGEREQTVAQAHAMATAMDVHPGWLEP